jgi:hypothetical protein
MRPHHARAIQKLVDHFSADATCLAIIVGGSVAKGLEREDSDVDVMLVVTDDLYRDRYERNQLFYITGEFCDYPGGYIDGKFVDMHYLTAAAARGNEVTRAAFQGAFVAHSKVEGLDAIVRQIHAYPADEQRDKIQAFYAQFECAAWYLSEAVRRDDPYLLTRSVADLVLYGGRLILAHNEILYPYHKHLLTELRRAGDRPGDLLDLTEALLRQPDATNARAFYDAIKGFRQWNEAGEAWQTRYLKDTELAWIDGRASPATADARRAPAY